eukprot:scaffold5557_cov154-Skeletonema_marinoi.AAC.13
MEDLLEMRFETRCDIELAPAALASSCLQCNETAAAANHSSHKDLQHSNNNNINKLHKREEHPSAN